MTTITANIYVASLTDYNNGILHGEHIDIHSGVDVADVMEQIQEMLNASPTAKRYAEAIAEEWAVHDYEGLPSGLVGSYGCCDLEKLVAYVHAYEEHGEPFAAMYDYYQPNSVEEAVQQFESTYAGEAESEEEYAWEYCESAGILDSMPEQLRFYFDMERYARDMFMNDVNGIYHNGTMYVFYNY